jgi:hypothetical protein
MSKQLIWVAAALSIAGCGSRQATLEQPRAQAGPVAYACNSGSVVVVDQAGQPVLFDSGEEIRFAKSHSDSGGRYFIGFARVGAERRPVALEYFVPADADRGASLRTFDPSQGGAFKVTAKRRTWSIRGEPSSQSSCRSSPEAFARAGVAR